MKANQQVKWMAAPVLFVAFAAVSILVQRSTHDGQKPSSRTVDAAAHAGSAPDADRGMPERSPAAGLRAALEESLFERLDPCAILDVALQVSRCGAAGDGEPVEDAAGRLWHPLRGVPAGLSAVLMVEPVPGLEGSRLGLKLRTERAFDPYWLEGVIRADPEVTVRVWEDPAGRPAYLGLYTVLHPTAETLEHGPSLGDTTDGVLCTLDLNDASGSRMSVHGMRGGRRTSWDVPVSLSCCPRPEDVALLLERLRRVQVRVMGTPAPP